MNHSRGMLRYSKHTHQQPVINAGTLPHNKLGSIYSIIEYSIEHSFFRFLMLLVSIFCVIFLVRMLINTDFDTTYATKEIVLTNVLYNPDTFSYVDTVTGRAYPGVIDLSKFSDPHANARLDSAVYLEGKNTHVAAQFTLKDQNGNTIGGQSVTMNQAWFTIKHSIAESDHAYDAGLVLYHSAIPVIYIPDAAHAYDRKDAILTAEIIVATY